MDIIKAQESLNIVICNDFGSINGGAAKVAINSAIGLAKHGYNVIFFCGVGPIEEDLKKNVKEVICLDQKDILNNSARLKAITGGIWNHSAKKAMDQILKRLEGKTIVHIHGWTKCLTSSIFKACHDNGVVPFVSIHDYFAACPNGGFYNYRKETICKYPGICIGCLLNNCDSRSYIHKVWRVLRQIIQDRYVRRSEDIIYIATSCFSYNAIKTSLKSNKVRWVKNPINIYKGPFVKCAENEIFLFIGRISEEKGADLFCDAISRTSSKGIVIGSGNELEAYRKKYKGIEFVGWKNFDEMEQYISKTRALVVSSRYYEGSPLIVPEMQCYGIPCIVPDKCAASDTIKDGINGKIFSSGSLESLCRTIEIVKHNNNTDSLFHPENWDNEYISMEKHIEELIKAYGVE